MMFGGKVESPFQRLIKQTGRENAECSNTVLLQDVVQIAYKVVLKT